MKAIISKVNFNLILSASLMSIYLTMCGCIFAFSSPLFAQLEDPTSNIKLTGEEASWIASIPITISPVGLIIAGILMDKFGRRFTLQLAYIPLIISWVVLGFAKSYKTILIGRFISGTTLEVSPAKRRAMFIGSLSLFGGIGNILVSALSVFIHWNTVSLLLAAVSVAGCASLFFVPESPLWLRDHGRVAEAEAAERWFGATADGVAPADEAAPADGAAPADEAAPADGAAPADEAAPADGAAPADEAAPADGAAPADASVSTSRAWWRPYARPAVWKPALVTIGFFACQQCSGVYVLLFYSADVLRDCGVPWDSSAVTVYLFAVRMLGGLVFISLSRVGRKTLGAVSSAGIAVTQAFLVATLRLPLDEAARLALGPVVVGAFTANVFISQVGMLPLPWTLCSEVFPMEVKGKMAAFGHICGYISLFIIIKIYPLMVYTFGIQNVWTIFTLSSILSSLYCIFILPETQGVTLDEILTHFEPKKKPTQSTTITSPQLEN